MLVTGIFDLLPAIPLILVAPTPPDLDTPAIHGVPLIDHGRVRVKHLQQASHAYRVVSSVLSVRGQCMVLATCGLEIIQVLFGT